MAPALTSKLFHPHHLHLFSSRAEQDPNNPPLASVFALIINRAQALASSSVRRLARSLESRNTSHSTAPLTKLTLVKRQQEILVIPTTYDIRGSPSPGAVVGIVLGAVLGFLLCLFLLLWIFRITYGGDETIIEEEVIRRRSRSHHSHRSKHTATVSASSQSMSEAPIPHSSVHEEPAIIVEEEIRVESRRASRASRRTSARASRVSHRPLTPEEVIVEEELSHHSTHEDETVEVIEEEDEHDAVVVEEEEDDIVEVIEEHSPAPPSRRHSSRRSGHFRTVDPTEFGGGDAPSRRISRASRRS